MTKDYQQRSNRCNHMYCAVAHNHPQNCNCDMSVNCPICRQEQLHTPTFRAWDGKEWRYTNLFLSHDGKLWHRYDGRKLKEVDWKLQFNY